MSSTVVSKNTYELLGNDPELDPERATPQQPLNVKTQPTARSGKRGGPDERKTDGSFAANSTAPKSRDGPIRQDRVPDRTRGGNRERGGRGGRGGDRAGRKTDDRHSKTGISEHQKQVDRGWGANTGEGEFADETNGLADARKEEDAEAIAATDATPVDGEAAPEPEEDKTMSYEQYLAEQASKREQFALAPAARPANEGANVKFPEGKALSRDDEEEDLIPAKHKQPRERHRTQTHKYETIDVDLAWVEQPQSAGGRGGDRGGRGGRGGFRGDREGGRGSGEGRGRGDGFRGGERRGGRGRGDGPPRGDRGGPRAPRAARGAAFNVTDNNAFPALG